MLDWWGHVLKVGYVLEVGYVLDWWGSYVGMCLTGGVLASYPGSF